jgi:hypothetical protein
MDQIFNICVQIMVVSAHMLGLSYQQWNVILFVIIHPLITLILLGLVLYYKSKTKKLDEQKRYHGGAVIY